VRARARERGTAPDAPLQARDDGARRDLGRGRPALAAQGDGSMPSLAPGPPGPACSVAFGGAFFGWPYHAGVAAYLQAHGGGTLHRIYGTSSGAIVAAMLACGIDVASDGLELGLRADLLGARGRRTPFLRPQEFFAPHLAVLERALPRDAHERATGRLFITLRRVRTWRRIVVSEFPTRDALVDALVGAVAVPGLTVPLVHRSPRFGAVIDGGPGVPDDDRAGVATLRIGAHPERGYHIAPLGRLGWRLLLTVAADERRREMFELGRADAARYFARCARRDR
jgi:hypothetical protein